MNDVLEQFRRELFPDTERHRVNFEILSEDWKALQALFSENGWTQGDGLRYTLAAGQAYVDGQVRLLALQRSDADPSAAGQALPDEVQRLQRERMQVESRDPVMKYRAYNFVQAAKILEMKLNAWRAELQGLSQVNEI